MWSERWNMLKKAELTTKKSEIVILKTIMKANNFSHIFSYIHKYIICSLSVTSHYQSVKNCILWRTVGIASVLNLFGWKSKINFVSVDFSPIYSVCTSYDAQRQLFGPPFVFLDTSTFTFFICFTYYNDWIQIWQRILSLVSVELFKSMFRTLPKK